MQVRRVAPSGWALSVGKPERDLALGRIDRIGPVHHVELYFQREVASDGAGCGLLDRVGAPGKLPKRRDRSRSLHDCRHHGPRSDEFQQRSQEWLALVLRVMLAGQRLTDLAKLQRRDGEAFSLDAADDLAYQLSLDTIGLDQYEGPFGHGR